MEPEKAALSSTPDFQEAHQSQTTISRARGRRRLCIAESGGEDSPLSRRARELEELVQAPDAKPEDVRRIEWVLAIIIHVIEAKHFSFSDAAFQKVIDEHGKRVARTIRTMTERKRTGKKIKSGAVPCARTLWRWLNDYL